MKSSDFGFEADAVKSEMTPLNQTGEDEMNTTVNVESKNEIEVLQGEIVENQEVVRWSPETCLSSLPDFKITMPTHVYYVEPIKKSWNKCVEGILETAILLAHAKKNLKEKNGLKPIAEEVGFTMRTVNRLIAIGEYAGFRTHVSLLPPSWGTLYQLTRLDDDDFENAIQEERITPTMIRREAMELVTGPPAEKVNCKFNGMVKAYVVYVDESKVDEYTKAIMDLEKNEGVKVDDKPITDWFENQSKQQSKVHDVAVKKGRREAIRDLKSFKKNKVEEYRSTQKTKKEAEELFREDFGEFSDFFEGDPRGNGYVEDPFFNGENNITKMLRLVGKNKTCEDYENEAIETALV